MVKKNLLVVGGLGFVGSNFVNYMTKKHFTKYNVIILDKSCNIENVIESKNIHLLREDILDYEKVKEILVDKKIDIIVNFAELNDRRSKSKELNEINLQGTKNLLEAAYKVWGENSDNKFIQISNSEVYGIKGDEYYFTELDKLDLDCSEYIRSKVYADWMSIAYFKQYGLNINIARLSNCFGPNQKEDKLIPRIIYDGLFGKKVVIKENMITNYISVNDACIAIDLILQKGVKGEIYNIAGNKKLSNLDIAKYILSHLGEDEKLVNNTKNNENKKILVSNTKIEKELNFKENSNFEKEMNKTIIYYVKKFSKEKR